MKEYKVEIYKYLKNKIINLKNYHQIFLWIALLGVGPVLILGAMELILWQFVTLVIQVMAFALFLTTKYQDDET